MKLIQALRNGDLKGVAQIYRKVVPYIRELTPHVDDENLQNWVKTAADGVEKVIETLKVDGANMWTPCPAFVV